MQYGGKITALYVLTLKRYVTLLKTYTHAYWDCALGQWPYSFLFFLKENHAEFKKEIPK